MPVAAVADTVVRSSGDTRILLVLVPPVIVGVAKVLVFSTEPFIVLLVKVSVVALPTKVSVAAGSVSVVVPATAVA